MIKVLQMGQYLRLDFQKTSSVIRQNPITSHGILLPLLDVCPLTWLASSPPFFWKGDGGNAKVDLSLARTSLKKKNMLCTRKNNSYDWLTEKNEKKNYHHIHFLERVLKSGEEGGQRRKAEVTAVPAMRFQLKKSFWPCCTAQPMPAEKMHQVRRDELEAPGAAQQGINRARRESGTKSLPRAGTRRFCVYKPGFVGSTVPYPFPLPGGCSELGGRGCCPLAGHSFYPSHHLLNTGRWKCLIPTEHYCYRHKKQAR